MKFSEHTFNNHGLEIHYVEWRSGKATPFILIHGFLDHARSWDPFVAALQAEFPTPRRIIALDCRGHGDSGWVGAGGYYHFPDYVSDLNALITELAVPSVHLLGHSMGGTISFLYTGTFPKRVRKLILVEGIGPHGLPFTTAPRRMGKWIAEVQRIGHKRPVEYSNLEKGAQRLRRNNPRLNPDLALHLARNGMKQTTGGQWVWKFDPLHRTTSPQPFYTEQALQFLHRIECPVLLVTGEESRQIPRADKKQRIEAIANRTLVGIEHAGHMIHHDNPTGLARAVADFHV